MTSRRQLKGDTTSMMLVHSLAISQVMLNDATVSTHRLRRPGHPDFLVDQAMILVSDLTAAVGDALRPSTLQGIVSRHPALHRSGDRIFVDVASRRADD